MNEPRTLRPGISKVFIVIILAGVTILASAVATFLFYKAGSVAFPECSDNFCINTEMISTTRYYNAVAANGSCIYGYCGSTNMNAGVGCSTWNCGTNASGVIQLAINSIRTGPIEIQSGYYKITREIVLPGNEKGITLTGTGFDFRSETSGTILQAKGTMPYILAIYGQFDIVEYLEIDGNYTASNGILLAAEDTYFQYNLVRNVGPNGVELNMGTTVGDYSRWVMYNEFDSGSSNGVGILLYSPLPNQEISDILYNKFGLASNLADIETVNGTEGSLVMGNHADGGHTFLLVPSGTRATGLQLIANTFGAFTGPIYNISGSLTNSIFSNEFVDGYNSNSTATTPNYVWTGSGSVVLSDTASDSVVQHLDGPVFSYSGSGVFLTNNIVGYDPLGLITKAWTSSTVGPAGTEATPGMSGATYVISGVSQSFSCSGGGRVSIAVKDSDSNIVGSGYSCSTLPAIFYPPGWTLTITNSSDFASFESFGN